LATADRPATHDGRAQPYQVIQLVSSVRPAAAASSATTAQTIARRMFSAFGWRPRRQFKFLNWLWNRESSWNVYAENPWSGAYGIPQAVPGAKMASAGPAWRTSATTQIRWGLRYIRGVYGKPRLAWDHEVTYGWY
jgi:hypothetical protein